jgi:hypothetical protein
VKDITTKTRLLEYKNDITIQNVNKWEKSIHSRASYLIHSGKLKGQICIHRHLVYHLDDKQGNSLCNIDIKNISSKAALEKVVPKASDVLN